jgi:heme A synthase
VSRAAALAAAGWLDTLHRDASLVVLAGAVFVALRMKTKWAYIAVALASLQIGLGAAMAYMALPPAAQVGHLTVASLLLGAETVVLLLGAGRAFGPTPNLKTT